MFSKHRRSIVSVIAIAAGAVVLSRVVPMAVRHCKQMMAAPRHQGAASCSCAPDRAAA